MLTNYLKIAFRNLRRHQSYAWLNVAGLALGLASAILILLYVQDELSYDRYHEKSDRIYRLVNTGYNNDDYTGIAKVNGPWGPAMRDALPEVEEVTRFVFFGQALMERGETSAYQSGGFFADDSVFDLFDYRLLAGDRETALAQPRSIVFTEELAEIYFGDENPIGQTIEVDNSDPNTLTGLYTVTGLLENVPAQSHFTFRYLVSMDSYTHPEMNNWVIWNQFYTYVLLDEDASPVSVSEKFEEVLADHIDADQLAEDMIYLQPLTDIHLKSTLFREIAVNGDMKYVYIFASVAFFILLIACINFINLATARSTKRSKEVGIRKVSGAHRSSLIWQFMSESFLMTTIALLVAIGLVILLLDEFNLLAGKSLQIASLLSIKFIVGLTAIWLGVAFIAGGYPAFVLSRFKPAVAMKGDVRGAANNPLRKSLVVVQFTVSAFLIIATAVVLQQVRFIQDRKLGFTPEQLINVPIRDDVFRNSADIVKRRLMEHPGVVGVSVSGNLPGGGDWGIPIRPEGLPVDSIPETRMLVVDEDFIPTFRMELVAGKNFSIDRPAEAASGYLLNEEAVRQYGWEAPLERSIAMPAIGREAGPVIGVLKDFHFRSMHEQIAPIVFFKPPADWYSIYSIRLRPDMLTEALNYVEETWSAFDPVHPFTYTFFDEQFGALHATETRTGDLLSRFALLAILISCMGLFGLAVFTVSQRTKEIGVRKVIGATVGQIVWLLTGDFTRLVLLGFGLSVPLAFLATRQWLATFAYQAGLSWWIFAGAGVLVLLITFVTVSYQSIRAGLSNPVEALRYE